MKDTNCDSEQQPLSPEDLEKIHQEWMQEFLIAQWEEQADDPYQAFVKLAGDDLPYQEARIESVLVTLGINPWPDDEGNYDPFAYYQISADGYSYSSSDDEHYYGDISQLDYLYSGPAISDLLSKTRKTIRRTDHYYIDVRVVFLAEQAAKLESADEISQEDYLACFSIRFL